MGGCLPCRRNPFVRGLITVGLSIVASCSSPGSPESLRRATDSESHAGLPNAPARLGSPVEHGADASLERSSEGEIGALDPCVSKVKAAGLHDRTIVIDGTRRSYRVHVPRHFTGPL